MGNFPHLSTFPGFSCAAADADFSALASSLGTGKFAGALAAASMLSFLGK